MRVARGFTISGKYEPGEKVSVKVRKNSRKGIREGDTFRAVVVHYTPRTVRVRYESGLEANVRTDKVTRGWNGEARSR